MFYAIKKHLPFKKVEISKFFEASKINALIEKNASVEKLSRPLFKFEVAEKVILLDFDGVLTDEKVLQFFEGSILFYAKSASGYGSKFAIRFSENTTLEAVKNLIYGEFPNADKHSLGFRTNCFLPSKMLFIDTKAKPFTIAENFENKPEQTNLFASENKPKTTLDKIAAQYPQTSEVANSSVFSFMLKATRYGFDSHEIEQAAGDFYNLPKNEIKRQLNNAITFVKNSPNTVKSLQQTTGEKMMKDVKEFLKGNEKFLAINAQTGTGKTYTFLKNDFENEKIIFCSPFVSIAKQSEKEYGRTAIYGNSHDVAMLEEINRAETGTFIVTYDSVNKLDTRGCILVVDEAHEYINSLTYRKNAIQHMKKAIKNAKKVVYLSATQNREFFRKTRVRLIEYKGKDEKRRVNEIVYKGDTLAMLTHIINDRKEGEKLALFLNSKEAHAEIVALLGNENVESIASYEDTNKMQAFERLIETSKLEKDVTLLTSKFVAGGNIIMPNDDLHLVAFFPNAPQFGINAADIVQFFGRARKYRNLRLTVVYKDRITESKRRFLDFETISTWAEQQAFGLNMAYSGEVDLESIFGELNYRGTFGDVLVEYDKEVNKYRPCNLKIALSYAINQSHDLDNYTQRVREYDDRYIFGKPVSFEFEKAPKKDKTEQNEIERAQIEAELNGFFKNSDHIKFVAKTCKNAEVRKHFGTRCIRNDYDTPNTAQRLILNAIYEMTKTKFISESDAVQLIRGKTFKEIEEVAKDAQSFILHNADNKKLTPLQREMKKAIEFIIREIEHFEGGYANKSDITGAVLKAVDKHRHSHRHGIRVREMTFEKIKTIVSFRYRFTFDKAMKAYKVEANENFFEPNPALIR